MTTITLGNNNPKLYIRGAMGEEATLDPVQDAAPSETMIVISPDSTLSQAFDEVIRIWDIHSHDEKPTSISGDDATLVAILKDCFK